MKLGRPNVFHPRIVLASCPQLVDGDGDDDGLVAALRDLEVADGTADTDALRTDLQRMLDTFADSPAGDVPVAEILSGLLTTVRRHRLRLPPDLLLLLATVVECEGVAVQLDPGFVLYPVLARWAAAGLAGE